MSEKIKEAVILPGSYDPITNGHLDIIRRASEKYEEVYVVAFINPDKNYTFSVDERVSMMMLATDDLDNVLVSFSSGLVIDYMRDHDIKRIIKGYRNETDLEYEKKMAEWNLLHGGYETIFEKSSIELSEISSTMARDMIKKGDDLSEILPKKVADFIKSR